MVSDVVINHSVAWGFFDGACQAPDRSCGIGFIFHLSEFHFISGKANLGQGTNNLGEFKALFNLLKIVVLRNISNLQVFRDSKLVIDWMKKKTQVTNLGLQLIAPQLQEISALFNIISFTHIRREFNSFAYALSKYSLLMSENHFVLEELYEGGLISK
jgi:ribonuclease HI